MLRQITFAAALLVSLVAALPTPAAVFLVPSDRELIHSADAIVLANVSERHTEFADNGDIVTIADLEVLEVLKGDIAEDQPLRVRVPGGAVGRRAMFTSATVSLLPEGRLVLFLQRTEGGWWTSYGLTLGAFHATKAKDGTPILVRGSHGETIIGFAKDDLRPWDERARNEKMFLGFIRSVVHGRSQFPTGAWQVQAQAETAEEDYFVDTQPQNATFDAGTQDHVAPSAYTQGTFRWDVFDRGGSVTFRITGSQPGFDSAGAAQRALAAWTNEPGSNVAYLLGAGSGGGFTEDRVNSIVFNSPTDVPSGAIAYAKWYANATHVYKGVTFYSISEGDVVVRSNLSATQTVFEEAVTHELGHTLGFRHSDQGTPASSDAVMRSVVTGRYGANLGPWDVEAVQHVYTGSTPACSPPVIATHPTSRSIQQGQSTTLSVTATGTAPLSYQWYIGSSGTTSQPIPGATGPSITVTPSTTTSYWVRVTNSCGAANSNTATVTVTSSPPPPGPTGTPEGRSFSGDFNGDGRSDILLQNTSTGEVAIWLMNGFQIVSASVIGSPGSSWRVVGPGDFNGDGRSDVLLQNRSTGEIAIWLMNGLTITSAGVIGSPGPAYLAAATGDFNGDNRDDVVLRNTGTSAIAIWMMNGLIITAGGVIAQPGTAWRVATTGDLNADGRSDIILQNTSTAVVAAWLMNGFTITGGANVGAPATSWQVIVSGDLNGDGRWDILLQNSATAEVAGWMMNGFTIVSAGVIGAPASSYRLATAGDFNADGRADLILQQSTGQVAEWQMNGLVITGGAVVGSPASGWRVNGY